MGHRVHRRSNEGNFSGIKQDRFRHSDLELEGNPQDPRRFEGVTRATPNTINGAWADNRGRRGDQVRLDNPFENGEYIRRVSGDNDQRGRGPRGYVRNDTRVHDDVCEMLTRDPRVDASNIEVKVESGIVTLSGKIDDRQTKRFAGKIIENIPGVKDVHNLLELNRS